MQRLALQSVDSPFVCNGGWIRKAVWFYMHRVAAEKGYLRLENKSLAIIFTVKCFH